MADSFLFSKYLNNPNENKLHLKNKDYSNQKSNKTMKGKLSKLVHGKGKKYNNKAKEKKFAKQINSYNNHKLAYANINNKENSANLMNNYILNTDVKVNNKNIPSFEKKRMSFQFSQKYARVNYSQSITPNKFYQENKSQKFLNYYDYNYKNQTHIKPTVKKVNQQQFLKQRNANRHVSSQLFYLKNKSKIDRIKKLNNQRLFTSKKTKKNKSSKIKQKSFKKILSLTPRNIKYTKHGKRIKKNKVTKPKPFYLSKTPNSIRNRQNSIIQQQKERFRQFTPIKVPKFDYPPIIYNSNKPLTIPKKFILLTDLKKQKETNNRIYKEKRSKSTFKKETSNAKSMNLYLKKDKTQDQFIIPHSIQVPIKNKRIKIHQSDPDTNKFTDFIKQNQKMIHENTKIKMEIMSQQQLISNLFEREIMMQRNSKRSQSNSNNSSSISSFRYSNALNKKNVEIIVNQSNQMSSSYASKEKKQICGEQKNKLLYLENKENFSNFSNQLQEFSQRKIEDIKISQEISSTKISKFKMLKQSLNKQQAIQCLNVYKNNEVLCSHQEFQKPRSSQKDEVYEGTPTHKNENQNNLHCLSQQTEVFKSDQKSLIKNEFLSYCNNTTSLESENLLDFVELNM